VITDHVFRLTPRGGTTDEERGSRGGTNVRLGRCNWLGACGQTSRAHITVDAYRARRATAPRSRTLGGVGGDHGPSEPQEQRPHPHPRGA
jgi:hypothetical protein